MISRSAGHVAAGGDHVTNDGQAVLWGGHQISNEILSLQLKWKDRGLMKTLTEEIIHKQIDAINSIDHIRGGPVGSGCLDTSVQYIPCVSQ